MYAAELIWRERDNHFDGIHDALPMSESTDWLSKFTAIALVEVVLLAVTMLVGIVMQTIAGYYRYELLQYFKELYIVTFPQVLAFALLRAFRPDHGLQQVRRPRHRDRHVRASADPVQLRLGEHSLSAGRRRRPTLTRT